MDCEAVRLFLSFPGELPPPEADALAGHLALCAECDARARGEQRLDAWMGRAMRAVPVPAGLKQRLDARLAAARAADRRRKLARWVAPLAAAAAAILLIGVVARLWLTKVEAERLHYAFNVSRPGDADDADEEFARLGYSRAAPRFVNYAYLCSPPAVAAVPGHKGVRAPVLVFAKGSHRAIVLAFDTRRVDLQGLDRLDHGGYTYTAEIQKQFATEEQPSSPWMFVVLYTGDNWNWLWSVPKVP